MKKISLICVILIVSINCSFNAFSSINLEKSDDGEQETLNSTHITQTISTSVSEQRSD